MNSVDREKRDREISALFEAGNRPSYIGSLYDLKASRVRRILVERGHILEKSGQDDPQSIWSLPTDKLREAIWERQREGARAALQSQAVIHANFHSVQVAAESQTKPAIRP